MIDLPFKSPFLFLVQGADCEVPLGVVISFVIWILIASSISEAFFNISAIGSQFAEPLPSIYLLNNKQNTIINMF